MPRPRGSRGKHRSCERIMKQSILVTGGAGFIGYHLARSFAESGYSVFLADNFARGILDQHVNELVDDMNVTLLEADLLNLDHVQSLGREFDVIFHLAAIIGVRHVLRQPYEVLTKNTRMLEHLIALAKQQRKLSRLLFASTSEVYAGTLQYFGLEIPTPESAPLTVTDLSAARTSYMLSKIMGEAMVQNSGLPFTIFRPHNIYGPRMGMAHVIPEQFRKIHLAKDGTSISVPSASHRRAFCFIDDAVQMLESMAFSERCEGKTLNLGTQSPEVSILDLVKKCVACSGKTLSLVEDGVTPGSPERRAPQMTKAINYSGVESKISLEDGLKKTWDWYSANVFGPGLETAQ